jgi:competence protein ComEA
VSDQPSTPAEGRQGRRFPGAAFLSALLIALALMSLVILARPRGTAPAVQALRPTASPSRTLAQATATATPRPPAPTPAPTATAAPPSATPTPEPVTVYVVGEVRRPGVYTLPDGSRVGHAIRRAGGMTRRADPVAINLALRLRDQMQVTVPARSRKPAPTAQSPIVEPTHPAEPEQEPTRAATGTPLPSEHAAEQAPQPDETDTPPAVGLININTATQAELESLPGIGPSKAAAIIAYREEHGPFRRPEDLQEVSGIGPKTWEQLKDKVTV